MTNDIFTCAEIGINHHGSLENAIKLIDVAADAGCTAVKFQKRDVENGGCYTKEELDSPRESQWGITTRQQKLGIELSLDQYRAIDVHCKKRGIKWFASAWDLQSVDFLEQNFPDTPFHKVASALLTNREFLQKLHETGRPVILSTGMSTQEQIIKAYDVLGDSLAYVLQCTSTYPCKPEEMNISYLRQLQHDLTYYGKMNVGIGFSSHYSGLAWVPMAIAQGAKFLEFHVTLDRTSPGSDQAASIEPDGVRKLMEYVDVCSKMLGDGKKRVYNSELSIIKKLRKRNDFGGIT